MGEGCCGHDGRLQPLVLGEFMMDSGESGVRMSEDEVVCEEVGEGMRG